MMNAQSSFVKAHWKQLKIRLGSRYHSLQGWMTSLIPLYIKTLYKDEPVFKNAKVVYSVFNDDFKESLGDNFAQKASLNELEDTGVKSIRKCKLEQLK